MATETTRRALFGSVGLVAVALAAPMVAASAAGVDRSAWDKAYAALVAARAIDAEVTARYDAACASNGGDAPDALEKEWEAAIDATFTATWALFETPSPESAAFLWKTEYLFGDMIPEGGGSASWSAKVMATYLADARRLLANGAA